MVTERPEASIPSWVLFRWNSGTIQGARRLTAVRSSATMPFIRLIIRTTPFS